MRWNTWRDKNVEADNIDNDNPARLEAYKFDREVMVAIDTHVAEMRGRKLFMTDSVTAICREPVPNAAIIKIRRSEVSTTIRRNDESIEPEKPVTRVVLKESPNAPPAHSSGVVERKRKADDHIERTARASHRPARSGTIEAWPAGREFRGGEISTGLEPEETPAIKTSVTFRSVPEETPAKQRDISSHGQEVTAANEAKDEVSDSVYLQMCEEVEQEIAQTTPECQLCQELNITRLNLSRMQVVDVVFQQGEGGDASARGERREATRLPLAPYDTRLPLRCTKRDEQRAQTRNKCCQERL